MKKSVIIFLLLFLLIGATQTFHAANDQPELRTEVVTIKYIDAMWARSLLQRYLSRKGKIQELHRGNKLVIEDTPEIVEKILYILKELDVKPLDFQFTIDLILGSMTLISKEGLDKKLKSDPLIKELRNLLKYTSFERLDSSIIKVQDNSRSTQRIGGKGLSFKLNLRPRHIKEEKSDTFQVELSLSQDKGFKEDGSMKSLALINTSLTLKSGDVTVVGVSKLNGGEKALILILSGKVIK